ncbi:maturation protein [ssRNA phage SRR6960509_6]|uniref:Maturation protein n=1 Tax=ssRNA phage SRR6960509_6 TaxID=2786533 RepID=A0A8S5L1I8_9VIRU|nr:maturation protein [ssRNA phage SRR6960509_6]DAD50970.1 TPA_asm: maturation protein [ssRNA phage SRR6960509_6]
MTTGNINWTDGLNYGFRTWTGGDGKYDAQNYIKENPYELSFKNVTRSTGTYPNNSYVGVDNFSLPFTSVYGSNQELALVNKIGYKLKEHQFMLGVAVAEARQTLMMAENVITTVGGVIYDLRHGQMKSAAQRLGLSHKTYRNDKFGRPVKGETLQGRWLQLQWGILPLYADVQALAIATAKQQNIIKKRTRISGWNQRSVPVDTSSNSAKVPVPGTQTCQRRFRYYLSEQDNARPSVVSNLGLDDIPSTAWELTHLSCAFDYFLPIGDYLNAYNIISKQLSGQLWYTDITTIKGQSGTPLVESLKYFKGAVDYLHVKRYQVSIGAIAAMDLRMPEVNNLGDALSPTRFGNLLALTMSSAFGLKPSKKSSNWTAARALHFEQSAAAYRKTI